MKAVQYSEYGDPLKVARLVSIDTPRPGEGEVLIQVEASPFRSADIYCMKGLPGFRPRLPASPGGTGIGRVTEVGAGVQGWAPGDRAYLPRVGTWREYMTLPAEPLFKAPREGDPVELAQVNSNGITAYALLRHTGELKEGDWVMQSAANSNVGRYLIQMAKRWGIRTVNLVRRADVVDELVELGADVVVVDGEDLSSRVADATGGAEIRLAFDMVGGGTTGRLAECLSNEGLIALFGQMGDSSAQVPLNLMLFKRLTIYGFLSEQELRRSGITREGFCRIYDEVSGAILDGRLRSKVAAVYPFRRIQTAIEHFLEGADGKIVIVPGTGT